MYFIYKKVDEYRYDVITKNDLMIGSFIRDVDGYFYFWADRNDGAWTSYVLRELSDKLNELNKVWDDQVEHELHKI